MLQSLPIMQPLFQRLISKFTTPFCISTATRWNVRCHSNYRVWLVPFRVRAAPGDSESSDKVTAKPAVAFLQQIEHICKHRILFVNWKISYWPSKMTVTDTTERPRIAAMERGKVLVICSFQSVHAFLCYIQVLVQADTRYQAWQGSKDMTVQKRHIRVIHLEYDLELHVSII